MTRKFLGSILTAVMVMFLCTCYYTDAQDSTSQDTQETPPSGMQTLWDPTGN